MRRSIPLLVLGLVATLNAACAGHAQSVPSGSAIAVCPTAITHREVLLDERGQLLHLSPTAFAAHDGALLLAGKYSATFGSNPQSQFDLTSQDSILALLRLANGDIRTFARPDLGVWDIDDVLAAPLNDSDWGLLVTTERDTSRNAPNVRGPVWMVRLSALGVQSVQEVPLPRGLIPNGYARGDVAYRNGRVVFALTVSDGDDNAGVLLLEPRGDRWNARALNANGVSSVAVGFDGGQGDLAVAVSQPDTTQRVDFNSLFLLRPDRPLDTPERLAMGGSLPIYEPSVASTPAGVMVGWQRRPLNTRLGGTYASFLSLVEPQVIRTPRALGDSADRVFAVSDQGHPAHLVLVRAATTDSSELDIFTPTSRDRPVRVRVASAGARAIRALQVGPRIVVTQPRILGGGTHLASELLWISARCEAPDGGK